MLLFSQSASFIPFPPPSPSLQLSRMCCSQGNYQSHLSMKAILKSFPCSIRHLTTLSAGIFHLLLQENNEENKSSNFLITQFLISNAIMNEGRLCRLIWRSILSSVTDPSDPICRMNLCLDISPPLKPQKIFPMPSLPYNL